LLPVCPAGNCRVCLGAILTASISAEKQPRFWRAAGGCPTAANVQQQKDGDKGSACLGINATRRSGIFGNLAKPDAWIHHAPGDSKYCPGLACSYAVDGMVSLIVSDKE
jgi:hypothetical protein